MARFSPGALDWKGIGARLWATGGINRVAILVAGLWTILVLAYAAGYFRAAPAGRGTAFLDAVFFLIALVLPIGLVALAAWLAQELARQRQAVRDLVAASAPLIEALAETRAELAKKGPLTPAEVDRLLRSALAETRDEIGRGTAAALSDALGDLAEAQRRVETLLVSGARQADSRSLPWSRKTPRRRPEGDEAQPALPIGEAEPEAELGPDEILRALDFPRDADDREGFAALRRALRHHGLARMLQAAEDVLNLLSQEEVFMDDLRPEPASAEAWRALASGRRGAALAEIGGIRDARALDIVRQLMRADPIFRDSVLVFQRRFDALLAEIAPELDDAALLALADTRSGRAFTLCARASGSFG